MTNFEKASVKIFKGHLLGRLIYSQTPEASVMLDFYHADVFFEKEVLTLKLNKLTNSFVIDSQLSEDIELIEPDVSDYWGKEFKEKILKLLTKYDDLFRPELKRFKNDIKMSISFKNKININDLKQAPYFMLTRDRRVIDEILNPLTKEGQI